MIPILLHPAYLFHAGTRPLLISIPHAGIHLPPAHKDLLRPEAAALPDTDWHLPRLYAFAKEMGASLLIAQYSRYLIDLNRSPDDVPLYTGATTGLFPETLFNGKPLYQIAPPDDWRALYRRHLWETYHQRLRRELDFMRQQFGYAILFDAHSIQSRIPRLFDGELPHFNLGTNNGTSCSPELARDFFAILESNRDYSAVHNGRFKGGYITRHYGAPQDNIHALQLELAQRSYMEESPPFSYDAPRAEKLQPIIKTALARLIEGL